MTGLTLIAFMWFLAWATERSYYIGSLVQETLIWIIVALTLILLIPLAINGVG